MAITLDYDDAVFQAADALFQGDSSNANGLTRTLMVASAYVSNAVCIGNLNAAAGTARLFRVGEPQRTKMVPRLEAEVIGQDLPTPDHARAEGILRLHLYTNRETPAGFGSQTAVALRVRQVFNHATPAATGGWTFSPLVYKRPVQAPSGEKEQHRVIDLAFVASTGSGGGF